MKQASIGRSVMDSIKKIRPEHIKKPFETSYKVMKKPVDVAAKGTGWIGKKTVQNPGVGVPALGLGGYGIYKFKDNLQKNYVHTDPQLRVTRRAGIGNDRFTRSPRIEYTHPQIREHFENRNLIY